MPSPGLTKTQAKARAEKFGLTDELAVMEQEAAKKQLALLKRQQRALQSRDDFMAFVKFTSPDPADPNDIDRSTYHDAKHHRAIARVIEEVEKGEIQFLILTMPPRHGKSQLVSRHLPAWYLGKHPDESVVVATYNDDFAKDFGADVRNIVTSSAYKQVFPETKLQRGGTAKDRLQTTKGGMGVFVGLGGSLTGRGAGLLVIDDVIKSNEEARSKSYRDRAWDWFTKVAMTRRMGRKLVIITFTRWHEDDIIGRLTDPENEHFNLNLAKRIKIIDLPAIAGSDDPLGRKEGEALWPDRYDLDFLEEQQALDPLGFEALYQQRPSVADGVLFRREHIRYYDQADLPQGLRVYCASDHAVTTNQRSDSTVLLKVGVDKQNNIYLLDCWWRKARTDVVVEAMLEMARSGEAPLVWWAEKGHISQSIGPFLRKRMAETNTFVNISEVPAIGDKEQRAQSISARMAMGYVHFPKDKPWVNAAVEQLMSFPNGKHDDFCLSRFTEVSMADGSRKRIDAVRAGDLVATPEGPCRVQAAMQTSPSARVLRVSLSDGRILVGTGNHPVFVADKGFVPIDTLAYGDVVFDERQGGQWQNLKCAHTKATATDDTRTAPDGTIAFTSTRQSRGGGFFTGTFGKTTTALFRKGLRFITQMGMRSTTNSTTLSSLAYLSTERGTWPREAKPQNTRLCLPRYALWLPSGTARTRAGLGTRRMQSALGEAANRVSRAASVAARNLTHTSRVKSSATTPAVRVIGVEALTNPQPVYNLTVENSHIFYANGILTHNCDTIAYIGLGLRNMVPGSPPQSLKKPPRFGTLNWVKEAQRQDEMRLKLASTGGF